MAEKRFQVRGWVHRCPTPKESDGVEYDLGQYDSREDAEEVKRSRLKVGWASVVILDRDAHGEEQIAPPHAPTKEKPSEA
jgi:hypothetical protein